MKSEINRVEAGTTHRKPFKKNQLVKLTRGSSEAVAMILEDEYGGYAPIICLYSNRTEGDGYWWGIGQTGQAAVEVWELFKDSLTLSN